MITPTIGRVVWVYPPGFDGRSLPFVGLVANVHNDRSITAFTIGHDGTPHCSNSTIPGAIPLLQDDDEPPTTGWWARWMPYQAGQASKTETLTPRVDTVEKYVQDLFHRVAALEEKGK